MTESTIAVIAMLMIAWVVVSGALVRHNITSPLLFTVAGYLLGNPDWGPLSIDIETSSVHVVAEVTLALLLFSDAARVNLTQLRRDSSLPLRLLGIGLPLTLLFGGLLAWLLLDDLTWALAAFVGAALAPTDAALSAQVISDERVPMRLRAALNVESGLNDGIATPVVTLALALATTQLGLSTETEAFVAGAALKELGIGLLAGLALGAASATAIRVAIKNQWIIAGTRTIAALATALGAYTLAVALDGNGFIAAFVAGVTFGAMLKTDASDLKRTVELPELSGELMALFVWFLFGATLLPIAFAHIDAAVIAYALASLTVVRMLPVILAMYRSGLDRTAVTFLAWFGPRGLASVVFALLAIEELGDSADEPVAIVALTVLLSVVLHGATAGPAGRRYSEHDDPVAATTSPGPTARHSRFLDPDHRHRSS